MSSHGTFSVTRKCCYCVYWMNERECACATTTAASTYVQCSSESPIRWLRTPCHRRTVVSCTVQCQGRRRRPGLGTVRWHHYLPQPTHTQTTHRQRQHQASCWPVVSHYSHVHVDLHSQRCCSTVCGGGGGAAWNAEGVKCLWCVRWVDFITAVILFTIAATRRCTAESASE